MGGGRTNVDDAMDGVLADLRFTMLLLPRQKPTSGGDPAPKRVRYWQEDKNKHLGEGGGKGDKGNKGDKGPKGNKGKGGKGKGKGKDKNNNRIPSMPAELRGGVAFTDEEPPSPHLLCVELRRGLRVGG